MFGKVLNVPRNLFLEQFISRENMNKRAFISKLDNFMTVVILEWNKEIGYIPFRKCKIKSSKNYSFITSK